MTPPRGNAEARRAEILDAALRVFGQYGCCRGSMGDIAREALNRGDPSASASSDLSWH